MTGEEAGDPAASVADMLDDPSSLESEINAGGGTVSGTQTEAVSANNCTMGTVIDNSVRTPSWNFRGAGIR